VIEIREKKKGKERDGIWTRTEDIRPGGVLQETDDGSFPVALIPVS